MDKADLKKYVRAVKRKVVLQCDGESERVREVTAALVKKILKDSRLELDYKIKHSDMPEFKDVNEESLWVYHLEEAIKDHLLLNPRKGTNPSYLVLSPDVDIINKIPFTVVSSFTKTTHRSSLVVDTNQILLALWKDDADPSYDDLRKAELLVWHDVFSSARGSSERAGQINTLYRKRKEMRKLNMFTGKVSMALYSPSGMTKKLQTFATTTLERNYGDMVCSMIMGSQIVNVKMSKQKEAEVVNL